jgi:NADH-quinone oxidoreductase subunit F
MIRNQLLVCAGGACITSGEKSVKDVLVDELKKNGIEDEVQVIETGCMGACDLGPIVVVYPEGTFYQKVTVKNAALIVNEHLVKGRTVPELLYSEPTSEKKAQTSGEIPFYTRQVKRVLRNCGVIDPLSIDEYIARDGYFALGKALEMEPDAIVKLLIDSGLRGRGGAGFPTGLKWKALRSMWSATVMKETLVHSWTAAYSKETLTRSLKRWPLPGMSLAPGKATRMCARSIHLPLNALNMR